MSLYYFKGKQKYYLLELLKKYENLFDGTLDKYTAWNCAIKLKEDVAFSYSKYSTAISEKKVDWLIKIGVIKKINNSQWTAPTSIITKINIWCSKIYLGFQRTK